MQTMVGNDEYKFKQEQRNAKLSITIAVLALRMCLLFKAYFL